MDWLAVVGRWPLETWITRFQEIIDTLQKIASITYLPAFIFCDVKEIPPQKGAWLKMTIPSMKCLGVSDVEHLNGWQFQLGESHASESHF